MNRRGFTLIELLAVIVLIGILGVLIIPNALNAVKEGKTSSYNTLIKNIVTSSQMYYEECEYGDLSNTAKYNTYACKTPNYSENEEERIGYIDTTLGALANTGFLNVKDGKEIRVVLNPINDENLSNCEIRITKTTNKRTYKVTYEVENDPQKIDTQKICPSKYK